MKRRRECEVEERTENGGMCAILLDDRREKDPQLQGSLEGCGFFDSAAVRAWYSGATQQLPTITMPRLHQLHLPMSGSLDNEQNSTETALDQRRSDGVGGSISDDACSESTNYDPNDVNLSPYDLYTDTELSIIDETLNFLIPSAERLREIKSDAIQRMTAASEEMQPCCICELSYDKQDVTQKEITDEFIQRLKVCITVSRDVPAVVAAQYSASRLDLRLQGLLLFPPAIMKSENGVWCQVCRTCDECITGGKEPKLPVNAIANGNYIGWLPRRFTALTRTDEQAVALVLPCVSLSVVTGGPCRTIKSHHYVVRNTEGPVTEMLPRDLSCRVRVTMVGHMTNDQVIACKRRYQLNLPLCRTFLKFLYLHNLEYKKYQQTTSTVRRGVSRTRTEVINLNGGQSRHGRTMGRENDGGDRSIEQFLNSSCDDGGVIVDRTCVYEEMDSTSDVVHNIRDQSTYSTFGSTVEEGADNSVEDVWIDASSVLQSQSAQHFVDVVVRKSNDYVPASKWAGCLKMFPTLFPAGVGGPLESRKHHMSVRQWILRCLRIHGQRFEKHYAFMLLAFDYLASEKARQTLYVKMNAKQNALRAAEIKRSTVLEAVRYFRYLSECRAKGMRPKPPNDEVQRVIDLRKGIRVPETAFYGSNLGRMRARFDLFGMLKRFGPLQLFFTISPDTAGTYSIAVKSGELSDKAIKEANFLLLPKRAERKQIAASYPVECARYFLRVMDTVIESFLGWDRLHSAPKKGGGLFGIIRAFGASAETQVAGNLHAHFAVWLHGFPTTSSEFFSALVYDKGFQSRVLQLVDSTLSSKPPCLVEEQKCVRCSAEGTLRTVVPGVDAYRRPAAGALPPTTSLCTACGAEFKDKDIIDSSILSLAGDKYDTTNSQWKDFEKCRAPHNSAGNDIATSLLVRDLQVHYWNHCKTCFKKTIRTPRASVCRFLKPEPVHLGCTTIDENQSLRIHRPIGCEYVNAYNTVVMDTIKCNHDAQFVFSNGSKATAAYVVKYCFKAQNPVENQIALSLAAFTKAAAKTNALPPDTSALERGYKLLGSMLYTVTNGQEVAAPMAALYILNETPFWFSHEFVRVDLWKLIQKQDDSVEISVSQQQLDDRRPSQDSILSANVLERYLKRDTALENVSFIEILEQYEFVKTKMKKKTNSRVRKASSHPKRVSFVKLKSPKILVVCGKEIPDIMSQLEPELRIFYYLAVITLFKPHRQTTLLANNQSPVAAYREFVTNGDSVTVAKMRTFENQWHDYYHALRSNDDDEESAEARILRMHAPATGASVLDAMGATSIRQNDDLEIPDDFTDITATTTPDSSTQKLSDDSKEIIRDVENLENVIVGVEQCYRSYENDVPIEPDFDMEGYTSRIISSTPGADQNECLGTHNFIMRFREARTRLEILRECFAPVPFREVATPQWSPSTLPDFPQIAMVSEAYRLNFWQHVIFEVAARHLLYSYSQDIEDALCEPLLPAELRSCSPYDIKEQLIGYLGGEAGTGKSTVVDALLTFANNWGRSGSVETLAFTGVASINIKGRTMHSARNLKLNGAEPNASPTVEMKSRFNGVVLVIIDEISITDQGLLGGTDAVSRSMSLSPDKFMGGKHTLLIGDLLQLPPVAGSPCFQSPSPQASRQRQAGYALYSAINVVVFLTKNMRARFDAEYTKILDGLRWGRISDAQLEKLNMRVQTTNIREEPILLQHTETSYRPIVVCTNKLRCAINNELIFRTASARQLPIYECLALPSARSRLIVEHLWNVNDNLTDRIPMKLLFFIGMPVMITHKHPNLLEADIIANGVIGTIVGTYPPLEELPVIMYEVSGIVVHKFIRLPALLLIKLHGVQTTLVHGFPDGVIGLPVLKGSVHLGKIPNLSQSSVTITQFALVPAFACTTEKLQGQTCYDGIVVTPLDHRRGVPCQTLYVALSRAVRLDGLTLTEPITRTYLEQFKPTEAIACEMQRLINVVRLPPYISPQETLSFKAWKATQHI